MNRPCCSNTMYISPWFVERTLRGQIIAPTTALRETIQLANRATNDALRFCHANGVTNYYDAHAALYRGLRSDYPALNSSLIQGLVEAATQITKREPDHACVKKPGSSVRLNARCFTPWLDSKRVSLVTIEGRKKFDIRLPPTPSWLTSDARAKSVRLRLRGSRVEVDFCFTLPTPKITVPKNARVVGVDLGVRTPAVTSTTRFLGTHVRQHERKFAHLRQSLQRKGTRSARRLLKRLSGRERRYMRDQNHILANLIVRDADVIVVEDLTNIRKRIGARKGRRFNRRFHKWNYHELSTLIGEKCEAQGKWYLRVDPRNTSKTCSQCGAINNVGSARQYACAACGFRLNRDLNAARNLRNMGNARAARLPVNEPHECTTDGQLVIEHDSPDVTFKPPTSVGGS